MEICSCIRNMLKIWGRNRNHTETLKEIQDLQNWSYVSIKVDQFSLNGQIHLTIHDVLNDQTEGNLQQNNAGLCEQTLCSKCFIKYSAYFWASKVSSVVLSMTTSQVINEFVFNFNGKTEVIRCEFLQFSFLLS